MVSGSLADTWGGRGPGRGGQLQSTTRDRGRVARRLAIGLLVVGAALILLAASVCSAAVAGGIFAG